MTFITAAGARKITEECALSEDSPMIRSAVTNVDQRIRAAARKGLRTIVYPFDGLGLSSAQQDVVVGVFRRQGFTYDYAPTQDPGSPVDRPYSAFSWP